MKQEAKRPLIHTNSSELLFPFFTYPFPPLSLLSFQRVCVKGGREIDRFHKEDLQNQVKFKHRNQLILTWIYKVPKPDLIYIHLLISNPLASTEIVFCCRDLVTTYFIYAILNLAGNIILYIFLHAKLYGWIVNSACQVFRPVLLFLWCSVTHNFAMADRHPGQLFRISWLLLIH